MKRFLSMLLAATMILASGIFISMTNMGSAIVVATDNDPVKGNFVISGEKIWDDNNNEAGARPESVERCRIQDKTNPSK
ncbi:MAG: hypothetical protein GX038_07315 [Erysipelothrix sp.]|nr:hypothetical protein [Erysipelothrix sp.]